MQLLNPGDTFPELTFAVPGGDKITVPEYFAGSYGVLLFFRGSWCSYCNAQLRAFQRAASPLDEVGVRVAALSVDDEAATAERMRSASACGSTGTPSSLAYIMRMRSSGRGRLPVCVIRKRSWLRCMVCFSPARP